MTKTADAFSVRVLFNIVNDTFNIVNKYWLVILKPIILITCTLVHKIIVVDYMPESGCDLF